MNILNDVLEELGVVELIKGINSVFQGGACSVDCSVKFLHRVLDQV